MAKARRKSTQNMTLRFGDKSALRFSQIRELYLKRDAWKGIKPEQMRARLEKMRAEFEKVDSALTRLRGGESPASIGKSIGVGADTITKWAAGKQLPRSISSKMLQSNLARRKKYITEVAMKSPRTAYLLGIRMTGQMGAYAGRRGGMSIMLDVKKGTIEKEVKSAFESVFHPHIEETAKRHSNVDSSALRVSATEIGQFLNRTTFYGRQIPERFLRTKAARRQFAMALVDASAFPFQKSRAGRKKQTRGILLRTSNREIRDYLAKTLTKFGIENNPRGGAILSKEEKWREFKEGEAPKRGKRFSLYIPEKAFAKFQKEIGFRDKEKERKLARFLGQAS